MVLFRCDANAFIGSGHVMRCMSIARAFVKINEDVLFVTVDDSAFDLISRNGFKVIKIQGNWKNLENELPEIITILEDKVPQKMIVDSYYVTPEYLEMISGVVSTVYIDDLNSSTWAVNYLVNYNIYYSDLDYSNYDETRTRLLLGPQYTPLRDEFRNSGTHEIEESVCNILVSAGGADPERVLERIVNEVCPIFKNTIFHLIVGYLNPRLDILRELADNNIVLHLNEKNMSGLMKKCDIAISAAGSTLYEMCATGLPTIAYSLADNQEKALQSFEKKGLMICSGDCRKNEVFIGNIIHNIEILSDKTLRMEMSMKMQSLVDGFGTYRLVKEIMK